MLATIESDRGFAVAGAPPARLLCLNARPCTPEVWDGQPSWLALCPNILLWKQAPQANHRWQASNKCHSMQNRKRLLSRAVT